MPVDKFHHEMKIWKNRLGGTDVFLTMNPDFVQLVGKNRWLREHVRPETIILIPVLQESVPCVPEEKMASLEQLGPNFLRVTGSFGFMQQPDVTRALKSWPKEKLEIEWDRLVCYLPEAYIVCQGRGGGSGFSRYSTIWGANRFLQPYSCEYRPAKSSVSGYAWRSDQDLLSPFKICLPLPQRWQPQKRRFPAAARRIPVLRSR